MAVTLFSESRLPGSDGAYTKQKIFQVDAQEAPAIVKLEHGLGRIPDWVRIERLGTVDPGTGAPIVTQSYALPVLKGALGTDGRFEWQDTNGPDVADLTHEMFFAAANADQLVDGLLLVEFGITHSADK